MALRGPRAGRGGLCHRRLGWHRRALRGGARQALRPPVGHAARPRGRAPVASGRAALASCAAAQLLGVAVAGPDTDRNRTRVPRPLRATRPAADPAALPLPPPRRGAMSLTDLAAVTGVIWLAELVALPRLLLHVLRRERRGRQAPARLRHALLVIDGAR